MSSHLVYKAKAQKTPKSWRAGWFRHGIYQKAYCSSCPRQHVSLASFCAKRPGSALEEERLGMPLLVTEQVAVIAAE